MMGTVRGRVVHAVDARPRIEDAQEHRSLRQRARILGVAERQWGWRQLRAADTRDNDETHHKRRTPDDPEAPRSARSWTCVAFSMCFGCGLDIR